MANAASPKDLETRQGNSFTAIFAMGPEDDPFDLTGSTLVWRCETAVEGVYLEKSTPTDLAMPDPTDGTVTLSLDPDETRLLSPGRVNRYELERRIGGEEITLVAGYMVVEEGVNDDA